MQYLKFKFNEKFYPNKIVNEEGYRTLTEHDSNKIIKNVLKTHKFN